MAGMTYRQLGSSGLRVSQFALGTASFGLSAGNEQYGANDLAGAKRQLDAALDCGVNFVDTADVYAMGNSETVLGALLKGRRDHVVLATKARFPMGSGPNEAGLSRRHLISACEASLRRLQTDHIDLYQLHEWDGQTSLEETLRALEYLIESGKVRYAGCSNFAGWQMMKAVGVTQRERLHPLVSNQVYLSLLERSAEYEIVPAAIDQNVSLIVWSPLAGGLLTGKFRRNRPDPAGARHSGGFVEPPIHDRERLYETVELLIAVAEAHGASAGQVALAWLVGRPGVTSVVLGARNVNQLSENLSACDLVLSDEESHRLEEASRPTLIYPHWHQLMYAFDRLGEPELSLLRPYGDLGSRRAK